MKFQTNIVSKKSVKNNDQLCKTKKYCIKVGSEPCYIQPKYDESLMMQQSSGQSESDSSSQIGVPKFHTTSINCETQHFKMNQFQAKEEITQQFPTPNKSINQVDSQNFFVVQFIIWLLYFIGSIENLYISNTPFLIIDCIANGISFVFVAYTIYQNRGLKFVSQMLHISSIILTITLFVYPHTVDSLSHSDKTFIKVIAILRTFRMLFPLLHCKIDFQRFKKGYCNAYQLRKIIFFMLFWLFFVGMFYQQFFADSQGNRCRSAQIPITQKQLIPVDERLCGQRNCPTDTFCTNPKRIGMKLSQQQQITINSQMGFFGFDSSAESMFSVFQIFTLNAWGKISQTYFNIYPAFIVVPFYLITFILFQFLIFFMILVFLEILKESQQMKNFFPENQQFQQSISIHLKCSAITDIKVEVGQNSGPAMKSSNNLTFKKSSKQHFLENDLEQKDKFKKKRILLYVLLISYSLAHYILASQFSLDALNFNEDLYNRKIGIGLAIFFILHCAALNLIKFEFLNTEEDNDNNEQNSIKSGKQIREDKILNKVEAQVTDIIIKYEYFVFLIGLADYILRVIEGKYILEEPSGLTFCFHFLLALRFYYVCLAFVDIFTLTTIKKHILLVVENVISGLKFVLIYILMACFLGIISFIIDLQSYKDSQHPFAFFYEINRILTFLINHSWQNLYNQSIIFNQETPLYVKIIGGICLIVGSLILMCYIISYLINNSFHYDLLKASSNEKVQTEHDEKQDKKVKIDDQPSLKKQQESDEIKALKRQKSFYIFSYENLFRQGALKIAKWVPYQETIRFNFFIVYLFIVIFSFIFCDNVTYGIISSVLEGLVFLDIVINSVALRFFGQFSYSENSFFMVAHLIACFVIIAFSLTEFQVQFVPILQICRTLVIFNYYESFQDTFAFIAKLRARLCLHFLILIPFLLGYNLIALLLFSLQNQNQQFLQKLLESLKISLILFVEKGWNLQFLIGQDNLSTLSGQLSLSTLFIIWMVFSLSFLCSLAGIILASLVKQKKDREKQLREKLCNSNAQLQEAKIKKRIKKMRPKFDYRIYGSGDLLKLCTWKPFSIIKICSCIFCFICFLVVNTNLTINQRIGVYSLHLFFFTIEIVLFIIESITFKGNQEHFLRDLILNVLAIPGSYIGFVNPVRYSNQSYDLKVILQLFNAFTVMRFVKIISYFPVLKKIATLLYHKFSKTLHISALILMTAVSMTGYLYQISNRKEPIFNCLNYIILGLFKGDFFPTIETIITKNKMQFTYQVHLLYFVINLSSQLFYSLQIAFFIFQVSETIKQSLPRGNTDISLYNFNKYFHEEQFLDEWMKIDPQGKGFVNFRIILNKSHLFFRHFSVSTQLYKSYSRRIQTFKKLNLQIYEAQINIEKQDDQDVEIHMEYAITFYDFLFSLNKYFFKEINSSKLVKENDVFVKNGDQQPVSFLKINSQGYDTLFGDMKKKQEIEKQSEMWAKQIYVLSKNLIKQRLQEHPSIQGLDCVIKRTNLTSQNLYYGYKIKGRFLRFLKEIKIYNEIKRNEQSIISRRKK